MQKRKVIQYSKEMEALRTFDSIKEAQALYHISHISLVCRGKRKSDGGYVWRYVDQIESEEAVAASSRASSL